MSRPELTPPRRHRFEGISRIASYNLPYYVASISAALFASIGAHRLRQLPFLLRLPGYAFAAATAFWAFTSLAVSHCVYDRSPLYRFGWLRDGLSGIPNRWVNVHNGLDEVGAAAGMFPGVTCEHLDIFDPAVMTEPAIHRARSVDGALGARASSYRSLPLTDASVDLITVVFTAHELRKAGQRAAFFGELKRILTPKGTIVLVEHQRDLANVLAFGPGAWHFLPGSAWREAAASADLVTSTDILITPFVHALFLRRQDFPVRAPLPSVQQPL